MGLFFVKPYIFSNMFRIGKANSFLQGCQLKDKLRNPYTVYHKMNLSE